MSGPFIGFARLMLICREVEIISKDMVHGTGSGFEANDSALADTLIGGETEYIQSGIFGQIYIPIQGETKALD